MASQTSTRQLSKITYKEPTPLFTEEENNYVVQTIQIPSWEYHPTQNEIAQARKQKTKYVITKISRGRRVDDQFHVLLTGMNLENNTTEEWWDFPESAGRSFLCYLSDQSPDSLRTLLNIPEVLEVYEANTNTTDGEPPLDLWAVFLYEFDYWGKMVSLPAQVTEISSEIMWDHDPNARARYHVNVRVPRGRYNISTSGWVERSVLSPCCDPAAKEVLDEVIRLASTRSFLPPKSVIQRATSNEVFCPTVVHSKIVEFAHLLDLTVESEPSKDTIVLRRPSDFTFFFQTSVCEKNYEGGCSSIRIGDGLSVFVVYRPRVKRVHVSAFRSWVSRDSDDSKSDEGDEHGTQTEEAA